MRIRPLHKIYLLIGVLSVIGTVLFGIYLFSRITPVRLHMLPSTLYPITPASHTYFADLSGDTLQERMVVLNNTHNSAFNVKVYQDYHLGLIDQFNFDHLIIFNSQCYADITGDNWKEIFIFTSGKQYLYLSIIDLSHPEFLLKEFPIIRKRNIPNQKPGDMGVFSQVTDINNDGSPELIFTPSAGYALEPRAICIWDIKTKRITHRFDHHFGYATPVILDLDGDGFKEIAIRNIATNNHPPDAFLSDAYSWLAVFDAQLHPLFPPRRMGEKFSHLEIFPFRTSYGNFFLYGSLSRRNELGLVDKTGKVIRRKQFSEDIISVLPVNDSIPSIYVSLQGQRVLQLDEQFSVVHQATPIPNKNLALITAGKWIDHQRTLLVYSGIEYSLLDNNLKLLARFPLINQEPIIKIYPIQTRSKVHHDFAVFYKNEGRIFRPEKNPWYAYLWAILFFLFAAQVGLYTGIHWLVNRAKQYISYFFYSIHHSQNAIILLDHKGRVITFNQRINQFLQLNPPLKQKQHFQLGFVSRPEIVVAIRKSMTSRKQYHTSFQIEDATTTFIGEITVTPFVSFFNFVNAYLVEIKDSTQRVLHERQQNWQKNIRRIVHDLKTPLAGVQLKLQSIYMRLRDKYPESISEVQHELEDAHAELLRIRNITRDFLKFSDLEILHVEKLPLKSFIEKCIQPFSMYTNESLHLHVSFAPNLPEVVYWDARQIELAIHCILENSLDALNGKGEITVDVACDPGEPQRISIRITDNGTGIPEEYKSRIFEPHFTTKREGSGLGLAFAKHIVLQHKGTIHFSSVYSSGTIFVINLPVHGPGTTGDTL